MKTMTVMSVMAVLLASVASAGVTLTPTTYVDDFEDAAASSALWTGGTVAGGYLGVTYYATTTFNAAAQNLIQTDVANGALWLNLYGRASEWDIMDIKLNFDSGDVVRVRLYGYDGDTQLPAQLHINGVQQFSTAFGANSYGAWGMGLEIDSGSNIWFWTASGKATFWEAANGYVWLGSDFRMSNAGIDGKLSSVQLTAGYHQTIPARFYDISLSYAAAIPEPATLAMLLLGSAGLFLKRRV